MKISRNSICPCGSEIKYKKCCLNKSEEQKLGEAVSASMMNIKNEARIRKCLHPKQHECQGKIVKAHAIQNNRILNRLAENGMVVTLDGSSHYVFQTSDIKGRGIATTFTGFCSYHDKTLFQNIEDKEFVRNEEQIFLLTYRTMIWHYYKKQVQMNAACIQTEKMAKRGYHLAKSDSFLDYLTGLKLGLRDNEKEKQLFDIALLNEQYDDICSWTWEIPYEISSAVSMMTELEHDICGKEIMF